MINKDFNSILELIQAFPNEQVCIEHLEQIRWKGNSLNKRILANHVLTTPNEFILGWFLYIFVYI